MSKIIFKQCRCIVFILFSTVSFADTKSLGDEESQYEVHHALYKEANLLLKNGEKEFETGFNYNTFRLFVGCHLSLINNLIDQRHGFCFGLLFQRFS